MASGRSSPAFSADSDEDGIDLTDTHVAVVPTAGQKSAAAQQPEAAAPSSDGFDVDAFVKERDAALAYDDSSLSELDSNASPMAATPRDGGTASTPNTENISVDIARRLDELEKIILFSHGSIREQS